MDAFQRGKFDLIIVDYAMPDMKGDKLAAAIKPLAPQQPIIMITAYGEALRFAGNFPLAVDLVIINPSPCRNLEKPFAKSQARHSAEAMIENWEYPWTDGETGTIQN